MLRTLSLVVRAIPVAIELAEMVSDEIDDIRELRTRMARKAMSGDLDDSLSRLAQLKRK